ncbi:hypothetical protein M1B78_17480 [Bacteroides sp. KH569_7]|uniref:Uncharacterized protein n=1 Tax=Bacteroides muris (ex Fokt et al. 2023) TaxID=2937417 RepID=A0A9X2P4P0_9BACE|nr:hypothetical protein [Bacteroides muris (ex Fokt et al. 2023)]MCR6509891.1 hypothetical protein [Bacteroides muris (ex Fokt et al. 2023)]
MNSKDCLSPCIVRETSGSFVRPCPQCTPPARRAGTQPARKGCSGFGSAPSQAAVPETALPRWRPSAQPVPPAPFPWLIHGGACRTQGGFAALPVSSAPSAADVAVTVCFIGMPFFSAGAEKRERFLVLNITIHIEGRRKRRLFPSINIIIFNTGIHASAPSGRHSCRRERSSSPPCPGLGHFLPASPGCVRCASTARCAACRPAKPWVMSAEAANTFPTGFAGRCRTLRKPVGQ